MIRGEATNDDAAKAYGFLSIQLDVEVDCLTGRDRILSAVLFPRHGLAGAGVAKKFSVEWAKPSPQAYLALVVQRVCAPLAMSLGDVRPIRPSETARSRAGGTVAPPMPPASDAAPRPGGWVAQVASSPRPEDAQRALGALPRPLPQGLSTGVETAQVHGQTLARAVVRGFATEADAIAFCSARTAGGHSCWVHTDGKPASR